METIKEISPHINFHDSALLKAEFTDGLYQLQVTVYAPNAGSEWDRGRFFQLTFRNLLRVEFEVSGLSMPHGPVETYEIYLKEGSEYNRWREALSAHGRSVCHVMLASSTARGWGKHEDLDGISIVCGAYDIEDVTSGWPDEFRVDPGVIPGPRPRVSGDDPPPRRPRKNGSKRRGAPEG